MADLSDKKSDLEDYETLEAGLRDNEDLIGLVELSDEDETQTLEEVDNNLKKLEKEIKSMKLKTIYKCGCRWS